MSDGNDRVVGVPDLSIVLACDGPIRGLEESVSSIVRACAGINAEIIIAHATDSRIKAPPTGSIPCRIIEAPSNLVPVLWGVGIAASAGRAVALTTTQFRVDEKWSRALLDALAKEQVAGVGGRMALSPDAGTLTRAAFFLRYSEHMGTHQPRDIAGDNAAYVRATILRDYPAVANGFWEVDAHRLMRLAGERFGRATDAVATFDPAFSLQEMISNRFVHGGHFGSYRVRALGWPRWRAVAVTPLVPFVLLARIIGRVRNSGQSLVPLIAALPAMVILLIAWAAGEARGALSAGSASARSA